MDVRDGKSAHTDVIETDFGTSKTLLFPHKRNKTYWEDALHNLSSKKYDKCIVRIAMARWHDEGVAKAVAKVAKNGCRVEVVTRVFTKKEDKKSGATDAVRKILWNAKVDVEIIDGDDVRYHSKYMEAYTKRKGIKKYVVWSGSHNFSSNGSNKIPEIIYRSTREDIFDAFKKDFKELKKLADKKLNRPPCPIDVQKQDFDCR